MNLNNILIHKGTTRPRPQNVNIIYLILNQDDDYQLNDKQEFVINLQLRRQYLS